MACCPAGDVDAASMACAIFSSKISATTKASRHATMQQQPELLAIWLQETEAVLSCQRFVHNRQLLMAGMSTQFAPTWYSLGGC
jgi:hypothetical protein